MIAHFKNIMERIQLNFSKSLPLPFVLCSTHMHVSRLIDWVECAMCTQHHFISQSVFLPLIFIPFFFSHSLFPFPSLSLSLSRWVCVCVSAFIFVDSACAKERASIEPSSMNMYVSTCQRWMAISRSEFLAFIVQLNETHIELNVSHCKMHDTIHFCVVCVFSVHP